MSDYTWQEEKAMRDYLRPGTKDLVFPAKPNHSLPAHLAAEAQRWDLNEVQRERLWDATNPPADADAFGDVEEMDEAEYAQLAHGSAPSTEGLDGLPLGVGALVFALVFGALFLCYVAGMLVRWLVMHPGR